MSSTDESVLYRLKNLNDHNVISVCKSHFKIGRATTNDLCIPNNRYVSSCHCVIDYDNGRISILDTSSNGTLLNRSRKLSKNETPVELHPNDIIHVVFRKDEPESNIVFQLDIPLVNQSNSPSDQTMKRKLSETTSISSTSPNDTTENGDLSGLMKTSPDVEMKRIKTNTETVIKAGDEMEDILTCVCCQDIMTNPICLEPCLHAFCSDCYASWEVIQRTCPKCRVKVTDKKKNVVINGILEAFLNAYPHKRPVLQANDNQPRKTHERTNLQVETARRTTTTFNQTHHYDDNEDDDEDDDDEMNENEEILVVVTASSVPNVRLVCRQCPKTRNSTTVSTEFQCRPGQNHILCQCCLQPMPDRQDERDIHQSCVVCHQYFCNMYFKKCPRQNCLGCLNQFRNLNFEPRHLINLVNDNPIETQIVQNYLTAKRATVRDLLLECCQRLDRKEFKCTGLNWNLTPPSTKSVCYKCGLKLFKELAFQFRVSMKPNEILPVALRNRENCYYGKECRTQYTKPTHAQKLSHACDQSRF